MGNLGTIQPSATATLIMLVFYLKYNTVRAAYVSSIILKYNTVRAASVSNIIFYFVTKYCTLRNKSTTDDFSTVLYTALLNFLE